MEEIIVGVATSVSRDKKYDPIDTLLFCKENGIALAQIFLDDNLINNRKYITEVRHFAHDCSVRLTAHAPTPLNSTLCDETFVAAAKELLLYQKEKLVVVHFDEQEPLKHIVNHIQFLNKRGFTVGLENYHCSKNEADFLVHIDTYNSVFSVAQKYELLIYPVLDYARLFITDIFCVYDSLVLTGQILDHLAHYTPRMILHLIDFNDYNQHRDSWCVLGKGLMPYKAIFSHAQQNGIVYDHIVLEYEDKELARQSIEQLYSDETIFRFIRLCNG
jgi:sugar phosphate isomerase/epimerase